MIFFPELKAVAKCEAPECPAAVATPVILGANGTLGVGAQGWQFLSDGAVFHTFCPEHHQQLSRPLIEPGMQLGPRGLLPMNGKRG